MTVHMLSKCRIRTTRWSARRRLVRGALWLSLALLLRSPTHGDDAGPSETKTASEAGFGSIYCGPRCVQRVLREYGIEAELIDLIREIQWPDVEKGSSFAALASALSQHGISTKAVELDPNFEIEWTHPAIVHLEQGGVAHYVVWLPPTEPRTSGRVWDNELTDAVKPGRFNSLRTGPVLLTCDSPILDSAVVGRRTRVPRQQERLKAALPWVLGVVGFGCGWLLRRQTSRRS